jgi:hypothetical protein
MVRVRVGVRFRVVASLLGDRSTGTQVGGSVVGVRLGKKMLVPKRIGTLETQRRATIMTFGDVFCRFAVFFP